MTFFELSPEVAGGMGESARIENSPATASQRIPKVTRLHYEFEGWNGDELLETFPCYIISAALRRVLEQHGATGVKFRSVKISKSELFEEMYPRRRLPKFYELVITGECAESDISRSPRNNLLVSSRIWDLLRNRLKSCEARKYHPKRSKTPARSATR